ncbi:peroxiredoxin [Rhizobium helianthi]|uniref:Peroxiredoxin n=1 Tax=Rhizobium helianthi TaxID=1132695 RepID=A0ABW4MA75_9HYPH
MDVQSENLVSRLCGLRLPSILLDDTDGHKIDLSALAGLGVIYIYPRTSPADGTALPGWDVIPGARGCTPQSCAFRDHFAELRALGVRYLYGLSTQETAYQREAAARLHLPFALLSDAQLELASRLDLPSFVAGGEALLRRMTLIIQDGCIRHVFYPIPSPERNAEQVMDWLNGSRPR